MPKILVKYLKGYDLCVPGDIQSIDENLFRKLSKKGICEKTELLEEIGEDNIERDKLSGTNIYGKKYQKGKIDVVIPTKAESNIKSLKALRGLAKTGKISLNIITREFNEQVGGFARSCNDGAKKGMGEFILFLNDDVIIGDNFFDEIAKPFENEEVGMTGARCSEISFGVNGSVMCIRRELFESMGGFDERYFFMWEDNDICRNIKRRGYRIEVAENADAKHEGRDSINTASEFWRKHFYNGKNYFEEKWLNDRRLIGSMIVGDENDRYMSRVIIDLFKRNLIDEMVVVCDKSNQETVEELEGLKKWFPITIHYHEEKLFGVAENILRERAVSYAISKNPFGIIPIDADEFFDEEVNRAELEKLLMTGIAWDFPLAHYWKDEETVRTDGVFSKQKNVRLFRYCPDQSQKFFNRNLHCGSCPIYGYSNRRDTEFVLKHFGYIKKSDVKAKKERQMKHDKNMLLENPDLYNRMMEEGETMKFNKVEYMKIYHQ